jgi:hypothetical protein
MNPTRRSARIRVDLSAWDSGAKAAERHAAAELALLGMVLGNVRSNTIYAKRLGLTADLFTQFDLRLIWCACDVAARYGLANVLRLARLALKADGYWDENAGSARGPMWTSNELAALAGEWLPRTSARSLPGAVASLHHVHGLMSESMRLQKASAALMARAADRRDVSGPLKMAKAG